MLKTRVITALVLLALFAFVFVALDAHQFRFVLLAIVGLAAWEWGRICFPHRPGAAPLYAVGVVAVLALVVYGAPPGTVAILVAVGALGWCFSPLLMWRWHARRKVPLLAAPLGLGVLAPAFLAIDALRHSDDGSGYFLWAMLVVVWCADIGAYFTGRRYGRRKLAPRVSPGKTWEGVFGGMTLAIAAGVVALLVFPRDDPMPGAIWLAVCAATAAYSVLGDLTESLVKRMAGVKDSSNLLPGHGGVLDRIDGILAAAPVFAVALEWLNAA